jgi:hypothetical protein
MSKNLVNWLTKNFLLTLKRKYISLLFRHKRMETT